MKYKISRSSGFPRGEGWFFVLKEAEPCICPCKGNSTAGGAHVCYRIYDGRLQVYCMSEGWRDIQC